MRFKLVTYKTGAAFDADGEPITGERFDKLMARSKVALMKSMCEAMDLENLKNNQV